MRVFLIILALVTLQNMAKADTSSVKTTDIKKCIERVINESQESTDTYELDESEAQEYCESINK